MRIVKILTCHNLLVLLLGSLICYSNEAQATQCKVDINPDCTVVVQQSCKDPNDTTVADVNDKDTVEWEPSGFIISVKPLIFNIPHKPFPSSSFSSGLPPQQVKVDFWCDQFNACDYTYGLKSVNQVQNCVVDPVVRVVPPGANLFLFWLVPLLGIGTYGVFRLVRRGNDKTPKASAVP